MDARQITGLLGSLLANSNSNANNPGLGLLNQLVMMKLMQPQFKVPMQEGIPSFIHGGNVTTDNVQSIPLQSPTIDVNKIAEAIGKFESGGNYGSIGVPTKSGDRALGKYQVMSKNIPSWSKEALGHEINTKDFMNNPEIQDAIAKYKMAQYLKKYGNVNDVSSMWFSGRPAASNLSKDVLGTSVPDYITGVNHYL